MDPEPSLQSQGDQQNHNFSMVRDSLMPVASCDESLKRDATAVENDDAKKSSKRRRSSLSTHRRSITGNLGHSIQIESGSQTSDSADSQQSSTPEEAGKSSTTDGKCLLPNPVNIKMDAIIEEMEAQINMFDDECRQWKELLKNFEEEEEHSKRLALNLTLPMADIPTEVKDFGMSEYVTSNPLDLGAMKNKLDDLLLQYQFDHEACMQNVKLLKETAETVRDTNRQMATCLAHAVDSDVTCSTEERGGGSKVVDSKQIMLNFISNA